VTARTFQELRQYSILSDCDVARISMTDDTHQEFFMLVQQRNPRHRRAERYAACEAINEAIDAKLAPGEVRVTPDDWRDMVAEHLRERVNA
jgi:hypothetical protein